MLVCEPFSKSFAEIAQMTDHQIFTILFHERDEHGAIETMPSKPGDRRISFAELFVTHLVKRGMTRDEAWAKLREDHPNACR